MMAKSFALEAIREKGRANAPDWENYLVEGLSEIARKIGKSF
jgi:hypothetical protein